MRVYDVKNVKRYDKLAEKRRRVWILKILFFIGLVVATIGFILYLLFFSGFLEIKELSVNGLDKVNSDRFHGELNKRLNSKWLGLLEYQRNVLFFNSGDFKAEALAAFPGIKEISVSKEPLHALNINVTERAAAGVWCFVPPAGGCKYFDKDGATWGEAAKSSGFLILVVDDLRQNVQEMVQQGFPRPELGTKAPQVDRELLAGVMLISERLKEMNIFINKFIIPESFIGDFKAFTSNGYELLFNTDSDISKQLEVLAIFLADKKNLSAQAGEPEFKPQYIDLRINDRIYYK